MKAHQFSAAEIRDEGPSLSPDFVQRVLEPHVAICPQKAQAREWMKDATREELIEHVLKLDDEIRRRNQRIAELEGLVMMLDGRRS